MKDLYHNISLAEAIPPAVYDADNTPAAIDLLGFQSAALAIHVGVGGITFTGTNKIEFVLTHSDDNSSYVAVTADDLVGLDSVTAGKVLTLNSAHAAATIHRLGYIGGKRYLKLLADFSGTHATGTPIAATAILGNPVVKPVS